MTEVTAHGVIRIAMRTERNARVVASSVRTLAAISSIIPMAAAATGWGVWTGDRRRGVNLFTSHWYDTVLSITGVQLNVIGRENLTARRPAVFIANHRNQFDFMILGALVRDNFTGVVKKELQKHPIIGPLAKVMDAAFIDRADTHSAVQTLQRLEELARKGISIQFAVEGTRVDTNGVGDFKKGAFRVAMSAGLPIVPVVMRNATVIAARDSLIIKPGTVDVAVLPPISVDDWTVADLDDRIAGVRNLYFDVLRQWPAHTLPDPAAYVRPRNAVEPWGPQPSQAQL
jgi:putative phosphoserine phosphatase/1-acylglycerol-3-phosphate O-acyltransferase